MNQPVYSFAVELELHVISLKVRGFKPVKISGYALIIYTTLHYLQITALEFKIGNTVHALAYLQTSVRNIS